MAERPGPNKTYEARYYPIPLSYLDRVVAGLPNDTSAQFILNTWRLSDGTIKLMIPADGLITVTDGGTAHIDILPVLPEPMRPAHSVICPINYRTVGLDEVGNGYLLIGVNGSMKLCTNSTTTATAAVLFTATAAETYDFRGLLVNYPPAIGLSL